MWYIRSLECASVIQKLAILEHINVLVLYNTGVLAGLELAQGYRGHGLWCPLSWPWCPILQGILQYVVASGALVQWPWNECPSKFVIRALCTSIWDLKYTFSKPSNSQVYSWNNQILYVKWMSKQFTLVQVFKNKRYKLPWPKLSEMLENLLGKCSWKLASLYLSLHFLKESYVSFYALFGDCGFLLDRLVTFVAWFGLSLFIHYLSKSGTSLAWALTG